MEELYEIIEQKISESGYPGHIDGQEFYEDVSAEVDDKENGQYMFMIKKDELLSYEGCMDILDNQFDLHYADIIFNGQKYHVDFDA